MAVFGRRSARQRLRKATEQALSVPTFRTPDDCTPWVLGGLWPAELTQVTPETAPVAEYLKRDLQRIADAANHKLRVLTEATLSDRARRVEQNRIVDTARAFAAQRVESTVRQLRTRHRPLVDDEPTQVIVLTPDPTDPAPAPVEVEVETAEQRLTRLVTGLARQEPGLRWAAALREDGTTVVATDLAHGWIPPGVRLPAGVDVLQPARRTGNLRALLEPAALYAGYSPGDPFSGSPFPPPASAESVPCLAPEVADLGWRLAEATRWRDGLARITHTLARSAAAGTAVVEAELDVLRVHLDTARYQLMSGYPEVDPEVLLNCLLLAATAAMATGDHTAANYHFAWFDVFT